MPVIRAEIADMMVFASPVASRLAMKSWELVSRVLGWEEERRGETYLEEAGKVVGVDLAEHVGFCETHIPKQHNSNPKAILMDCEHDCFWG